MVRTIILKLNDEVFDRFSKEKEIIMLKEKRVISWEEFFMIKHKFK